MNKTSIEFVTRLVVEKHNQVKSSLDSLLLIIAKEDKELKNKVVEKLLTDLQSLIDVVPQEGRPNWIGRLVSFSRNYYKSKDTSTLLKQILTIHSEIMNHNWRFDQTGDLGFNFDAIFNKYKKESRLNDLFDSIVKILEKMISDGHIDSIRVLESLNKIIATIKRNKNGSYFSIMSTWQFFLHFMKNVLWEELTSIPVLGTLLKALETTANEMDQELVSLHQNIQKDMEEEFKIPMQAVSYSSTGKVLSFQKGNFDVHA